MILRQGFIIIVSILLATIAIAQGGAVCERVEDCLQLRDQVNLRIAALQELGTKCRYFSNGYYAESYNTSINHAHPQSSVLNYEVGGTRGSAQSLGTFLFDGNEYLKYQVAYPSSDPMEVLVPVAVKKNQKAAMATCHPDALRGPCGSPGNMYRFGLTKGWCD